MKKVHSDILQYRGNHYQFGLWQGERLKSSLTIKNREKQWRIRKPRFTVDINEAREAILAFAPGLWDELIGLSDGLEWKMDRVLMEFGGYRLNYVKSGCSIMTGDHYFIRNYDYHPKTYEGRYIFFQPTDQGYATVGPSQRITGKMDGMNEKGLTLGYNFMHRKQPGIGFICGTIGRMVLESCANVEDAVQMLKEIPHRHSFSYILYDLSGETHIVEASPRGVHVRQSNVCTNHFEIMKHENRNHLVDSIRRMDILKASQKEKTLEAFHAFRLFNDTEKGVFSKLYGHWAGTIHTSAYFPRELKVWFAMGGDQEPYEFHFQKWLDGEDLWRN